MTTDLLTMEAITARRDRQKVVQKVVFGVSALYGLSRHSILMPVSEKEAIESGQVCISTDPESPSSHNIGIADFERGSLVVSYAIQAVFPGLFHLVQEGRHDPSLLHPVRAVATDECTLTSDLSGWSALGCLQFLPGSLWSGAEGG